MSRRRLIAEHLGVDEWVLGWSGSTAAPAWCDKFVNDSGSSGLLGYHSKHAAFQIVTSSLTVRLHHDTNHQVGHSVVPGSCTSSSITSLCTLLAGSHLGFMETCGRLLCGCLKFNLAFDLIFHTQGEVLDDGRVLPELEFWQMDVHVERIDVNVGTVTGILGETMRPVLNSAGVPIMSGSEALRGETEDYRVSGPLASDFNGFQG